MTHVEDVHSSVNALVFDTKQSILYSGDSSGAIKMWKINNGIIHVHVHSCTCTCTCIIYPSLLSLDDWTIQLHCNILIPEYKVTYTHTCTSSL